MKYEYRFFKRLPDSNRQQFIQKWLTQYGFKQHQAENRADIYVHYPNLSRYQQDIFGLKFRDVKESEEHVFKLGKLELKQNFSTTKTLKQNWNKLLASQLNNPIKFSVKQNLQVLSSQQSSQVQSQKDQQDGLSDFSIPYGNDSQISNVSQNDNFEIIKDTSNKKNQIAESQQSEYKFNDILELKSQQNSQSQSQEHSMVGQPKQQEEEEEKNENQSQNSGYSYVNPQQSQSSQQSQVSQLGYIDEDTRLEIQMAILEKLSQLTIQNQDNKELKAYYNNVANQKDKFELVLVRKVRFDDELSEQVFVELQVISNPEYFNHIGQYISTNIELKKEKYKQQKVINKINQFKISLNNEFDIISYPEQIANLYEELNNNI